MGWRVSSVERFLSVTILVPVRRFWLESVKALALGQPLAGLLTFVAAFCKRKQEIPPAAAGAKEFRAQARPQPSEDTPACPTSAGKFGKRGVCEVSKGGRTSGGCSARVFSDSSRNRQIGTRIVVDKNPLEKNLQPSALF
jgi:hypothetical protein